jgi:hypothetical protein
MSGEPHDLFGKIDALFEKHGPDALIDRSLEQEDFPVLDEIIEPAPVGPHRAEGDDRRREDRRRLDRRGGDRRQVEARLAERPEFGAGDLDRLFDVIERRLADLFIRQQLRTEEAVRRIVREEIGRRGSD